MTVRGGGGIFGEGRGAGTVELIFRAPGAVWDSEVATARAGIHREIPIPLPQLPRYLLQRFLFISFHFTIHPKKQHFQFQ
jgi:hypothetical protein